ncbi:hypothetical protein V494_02068 [Pseudogymnoascus sp. VKM F-4513 (FW-928)]|nr:hypothetical protein V494_02068 [Pseudogymnoascus sp. VKM F-4513 (FW-928)]
MGNPKFESGQVVFYRPMSGPNCMTTESTGIITDILMERGQQANVNVNASAAHPRYEIQNYNTGTTTSVFEDNIIGKALNIRNPREKERRENNQRTRKEITHEGRSERENVRKGGRNEPIMEKGEGTNEQWEGERAKEKAVKERAIKTARKERWEDGQKEAEGRNGAETERRKEGLRILPYHVLYGRLKKV